MRDVPSVPSAQRALAESLARLLERRYAIGTRRDRPVVAIAGESGSGKSATASGLAQVLTAGGFAAAVLHQDDYFVRPPAANHAHRVLDLASVGPDEVNLVRLREHADAFRGAGAVLAPRVDYAADRFVTVPLDFALVQVLIVEGTYVVAHVPADIRLFLAATAEESADRRRERNRDIVDPFVDHVLAREHPIVAAQRALADIVIDRDFTILPVDH